MNSSTFRITDILYLVRELPSATKAYKRSDAEVLSVVYDAFRVSGSFDDHGKGD